MAATITWSVDSHKHETAGKKCVLSVSYRVTGVDGDTTDSIYSEVSLDRPSDSDMKDYSEFLGTGDAALIAAVKAKIGAKNDGVFTAVTCDIYLEAGAYPGSFIENGCNTAFAPYDVPNLRVAGYDIVTNKPKTGAYRAPGTPNSALAVETAVDNLSLPAPYLTVSYTKKQSPLFSQISTAF